MPTIILQTSRHIRRYEIDDLAIRQVVDAVENFKKVYYSGPVNVKLLRVPGHEVLADLAIPYDKEQLLVETVEPMVLARGGVLIEVVDQPPETVGQG